MPVSLCRVVVQALVKRALVGESRLCKGSIVVQNAFYKLAQGKFPLLSAVT